MIQVSLNELSTLIGKATTGQGFDQGTGQWLSHATCAALQQGKPALDWALRALQATPEPVQLVETPTGWTCTNHAILVAGPALTDLHMAGETLAPLEPNALDVPEIWQALLANDPKTCAPPLTIDRTHWDALQILAAKTYVPATEESRQGAGAGTTDND